MRQALCTICKTPKRLSSFAPSELNKTKTRGRCRPCNRIRRRAYHAAAIERLREWDRTHPEEAKARHARRRTESSARRRARLKRNGGSHTEAEWVALKATYGDRCLCCGTPDGLTKDHIVPISRGGGDWIGNLQVLCGACNTTKGSRTIDYREDRKHDGESDTHTRAVSGDPLDRNQRVMLGAIER